LLKVSAQRTDVLPGVQYLRFVAAALVVGAHAWQMVPYVGYGDMGRSFEGGQSGVDIFFVISGFMMVHISGRANAARPGAFLLDRFTRIAPPYWLVTIALAVLAVVAPSLLKSARPDLAQLVTSLLFFPWPHPNEKMGTMPLLAIGWTLNYEILFYMVFAAAMLINHRYRVLISFIQISLLVLAGGFFAYAGNPWFDFYTNTLMLEFIFGMLVAYAAPRLKMPAWLIAVLFSAASIWFIWAIQQPVGRLDPTRWFMFGMPSAAIVLLVVAADLQGQVKTVPWLVALGNASYSLYLVHLFALGAIRAAWPLLPDSFHRSDFPLLVLAFATSIAASLLFHYWLEKPMVKVVRGQIARFGR
jgi:exopolysaccharide production protein ExoZ